ncbi:MAG TPA: GNAT family N-acetyltransferase [Terriglobales bacterium]|nr:GNAT family N-acetyltransferase [Terriglobales bacterium]
MIRPNITVAVVRKMEDYPAGLLGTIASLFGRSIAQSHRVDWTLDLMIAEQQCEFFRRFDGNRDRVWAVMDGGIPRGGLTIDGPRPETGRQSARLRFFILDEALRGHGLGRCILAEAMNFCREKEYNVVYLTTLPGLDAALHLYYEQGFRFISESSQSFHGSPYAEQVLECRIA